MTAGNYEFGDFTRQKIRDARSRARSLVVQEAVAEQRSLGKFSKLRAHADNIKATWEKTSVRCVLLLVQLLSSGVLAFLSYAAVRFVATTRNEHSLAVVQAAASVGMLFLCELVLAGALHFAATWIRRHSKVIEVFFSSVVHVDLSEVGVDLHIFAQESQHIARFALCSTGVLLSLSCAVWLECLRNI